MPYPQINYYIYTYGCQMNQRDSESIAAVLSEMGMSPATGAEEADLVIFNTCCVRESAERKIYGRINELKSLKRRKPAMLIGVGGCMAQKDREEVLSQAPHVDFVFGTADIAHLSRLLNEVLQDPGNSRIAVGAPGNSRSQEPIPVDRTSPYQAYVNISYGCSNFCSYCIVPHVRGPERSRPPQEIFREVEELARLGYKEITLLGQNVNTFGKDLDEPWSFADLLRNLDKVEGIVRIRFTTSHPRDFSRDTMEAIRDCPSVCEHVHLPVQAGSNRVLQAMNRGYSREHYLALAQLLRREIPGVSLTTDLIVGFPGETEEEFQDTLDLVQRVHFDNAFTFMFSPRSGTPAAKREDQLPQPVKKERLERLMKVQHRLSYLSNLELDRRTVEVLVEHKSHKGEVSHWQGRTRGNRIVLFPCDGDEQLAGELVLVRIDRPQTWNLYGHRVTARC